VGRRAAAATAALSACLWVFSTPARGAEEDLGFDLEATGPEEGERARLLRELGLPRSFVELGTYYQSDDSYKFGDFTGLDQEGFGVLGNFDLRRRAPWESEDTWSLRLSGYNLGLDSRSLRAEYGQQGRFDVFADFAQLPKLWTDDVWSPYRGFGGPYLELPPGWVASDSTAGFLSLGGDLRRHDIEQLRRDLGGGFSLLLPFDLELQARYNRETREGRKLTSALIGSSGGNPRAAIVAEPIDYETQEVDALLRFDGERGQIELGYYLSHFDDADESLTWRTAFLRPPGSGTWDPSASFPSGLGRKATPPDNVFHQIRGSGGYSLPWWNTRVTGGMAFGWLRQDQSFLPYTVNPILAASLTRDLPRGDLDGKIDTTALTLRVDSRPLSKLRLNGHFRYDDRDNETPRDVYVYVPGDAQLQGTLAGSTARVNRPYSYQLKDFRVEAAYEIYRRTELAAAYRYQEIERTFSEVEETGEDFYTLRLTHYPFHWLSLRVEGEVSEREGSEYEGSLPFLEGTTRQHLATLAPGERFENNPELRKFYFADRERSRARGTLTLMPVDWLDVSIAVDNTDDDYDHTEIGLRRTRAFSYTFDVSITPFESFTTHAFYSNERFRTRQSGHAFTGTNAQADLADPARRWRASDEDDVDTVGWGFDLHLFEARLTLEGDALYARSEDEIDVETRLVPLVVPPGTPTAFPTIQSDLWAVSLAARYRFTENVSLRLGYVFERLEVDDWSVDQLLPATLPRVLTPGQSTPDYDVHLVALSFIYEFR